jgi:hypothetical protein
MSKRILTLIILGIFLLTQVSFVTVAKEDKTVFYNDNFESGIIYGNIPTGTTALISDEEVMDGNYSLKISGVSRATDAGPQYEILPYVQQGHTYEISYWAKVENNHQPMRIKTTLRIGLNGNTYYSSFPGWVDINPDGWTLIRGSYTIAEPIENYSGLRAYIEVASEGLGTPFFIDELIIKDTVGIVPEQTVVDIELTKIPENLIGTEYAQIAEVLSALEIINFKDEFMLDEKMTRFEFGTLLEKFSALETITKQFINSNPEREATYEDVSRAFVNFLGYDVIVKHSSNRNYLTMANNIGLLKGTKARLGETVTNSDILMMLYNMTDIDILRPITFGNRVEYKTEDGVSIYTVLFDIYKSIGRVTGNTKTMLNSESKLRIDEVEIDGKVYKTGNTMASDYLAYNVVYYYKTDSNGRNEELLAIFDDDNDVITIDSANIISFENGRYNYEDETGIERSISIPVNSNIIYNGKYIQNITGDDFIPVDGKITFIDADYDGSYETLLIDKINYMTVRSVDVFKTAFYGDKAERLEFNPYSKEVYLNIRDIGEKIVKLNEIKEEDVLEIRESQGGEKRIIEIIVVTETVEGIVSEVSISGDSISSITVDNEIYILTNSYANYLHNILSERPNPGSMVKIMLNSEGKVVNHKNIFSLNEQYGYLVNASINENGLDKALKIRVLNINGEIVNMVANDKITFDGAQVLSNSTVVQNTLFQNSVVKRQVIGYRTNSKGEVIMLDTKNVNQGEDVTSLREFYNTGSTAVSYQTRTEKTFLAQCNLTDNTVVFGVPYFDIDNDDLYVVGDSSLLEEGATYMVEGYTISDLDNIADILVVKMDGDFRLTDSIGSLMVVNKITTAVNKEGETRLRFRGLVNGVEDTILIDDQTSERIAYQIQQGDIVRYRLGINGELTIKDADSSLVTNFQHVATVSGGKPQLLITNKTSYTGSMYLVTGTVLKQKSGYMWVETTDGTTIAISPNKFKTAKYDNTRNQYHVGLASAIIDKEIDPVSPSIVLIRMRARYAAELIIY